MSSLFRDGVVQRPRKNEDKSGLLPVLPAGSKEEKEKGQSQALAPTRRTKPSPIETVQNSRVGSNTATGGGETPSPLARMARSAANMACKSPLGKLLQTAANFVQKSPLGRAANSFCNAALDPTTPLGSVVRSPVSLATRLAERSAEVAMRSPVARQALSRLGSTLTSSKPQEEASSARGGRTRRSPSIPNLTTSKPEEDTSISRMSRTKRTPSITNLPPVEEGARKRSPSMTSLTNLANRKEEAEKKHYARLGMTMSSNRQEKSLLRQGLGFSPLTSMGQQLARQNSDSSLATTAATPSSMSSIPSLPDLACTPPRVGISGIAGSTFFSSQKERRRKSSKSSVAGLSIEEPSPEQEARKARKVGLSRIMYKFARRHHEERASFQARKAGTCERYPGLMLREVVTDLRLALRVVGHLDRFLLMLTPKTVKPLSMSMSEAGQSSSTAGSSRSTADETWLSLLNELNDVGSDGEM